MKQYLNVFVSVAVVFIISFSSCKKTSNLEYQAPENVGLVYPDYISKPYYKFVNNELTKEGIELGKILFYDPILSSDSTISCASCHNQAHGFADHNVALSKGVNNLIGARNSPALFNLAWQPSFMWDGGINHIEIMPLAPITNHLEMNETISNVLKKLNKNSKYKILFEKAFGKNLIDDQMLFRAFAQFISKLNSFESKYDKVKQNLSSFSADESIGYNLFLNYCSNCHTEPLFTNYTFRNNGLDSVFIDKGRYIITLDKNDLGKFKVPSLRNIELTYPYMHDGRFKTIREVLNHYTDGIIHNNTLSPHLQKKIQLNADEKVDLTAFLLTLTDKSFLFNPKFGYLNCRQ